MHSTQSCPDLFKVKTNKKTNIGLSRWPALGCCLLLAGVPHCHLFITSLSQPDSSNPVDTRASAEVALAISAYHKTFSFPRPPLKYQGSWERERARLQRLGLLVISFPAFTEVTRRCQIQADNWSIWKAPALTSLVTFKTLTKHGMEKKHKRFSLSFSLRGLCSK